MAASDEITVSTLARVCGAFISKILWSMPKFTGILTWYVSFDEDFNLNYDMRETVQVILFILLIVCILFFVWPGMYLLLKILT